MQRAGNTGHPCESRLHIDYSTNNHPPQLHAAGDLDCCFMPILSWEKPVGPRIMRKLWSSIAGIEGQLSAAAQRCYPNREDAEDPMVALPEYEIRHSGRVLELQNRDLWLRPTDMSWHFLLS